jgi:hypothetical protein
LSSNAQQVINKMLAQLGIDPAISKASNGNMNASGYVYNTYWNSVFPNRTAPSPAGVDLSQQMTPQTWWGYESQAGLSGLRMGMAARLRGLGCYAPPGMGCYPESVGFAQGVARQSGD